MCLSWEESDSPAMPIALDRVSGIFERTFEVSDDEGSCRWVLLTEIYGASMVDAPFMLRNISCISYVRLSSSGDLPKKVCSVIP